MDGSEKAVYDWGFEFVSLMTDLLLRLYYFEDGF